MIPLRVKTGTLSCPGPRKSNKNSYPRGITVTYFNIARIRGIREDIREGIPPIPPGIAEPKNTVQNPAGVLQNPAVVLQNPAGVLQYPASAEKSKKNRAQNPLQPEQGSKCRVQWFGALASNARDQSESMLRTRH